MDPKGHEFVTNEGVQQALKDLPPQLNWIRRFVGETMVGSVYRDMDDVFSGGHWSKDGQKHHFMRFQGQSSLAAFQVASKWIQDNAFNAATRLREIWTQKRGYLNPIYIQEPLGNAVHAIQDSYAEGHVTRKKEG